MHFGDFSFSKKGKTITRSGVSSFKTALVDWPVSLKSSSVSDGIRHGHRSGLNEPEIMSLLDHGLTTQSDLNALFQSYLGKQDVPALASTLRPGNFTITQAMPLLTLNPLAMVRRFRRVI